MNTDHRGLCDILHGYRQDLEPKWHALHQSWDDPIPTPISKFMCRYTVVYLQRKLKREHDIVTKIAIGRPTKTNNGTTKGQYGYCDDHGCYHDHAWLQTKTGIILDITSDQFGGRKIIITSQDNPHYVPNQALDNPKKHHELAKIIERVETLL